MITRATTVPLNFGGGLNTSSGPLSIKDNQSPNCKNVHSNMAETLQRRDGWSLLGTAANGTTGNGIFDYWKDGSTHYLMCYLDTYLYKIDVDGTAFDGTLDAITFGTAMSDAVMEFDQFNDAGTNYLIMATHSRDHLQKWTGSGNTTDLSTDADLPEPKYIKTWRGYLFCANIANYESRVYYNTVAGAIVDSTDWTAVEYQDIQTNDGDYITAMALLKGRLYTFKRNSIFRWTYLGGTPLFSIKTAISNVGTISSKSVVNISHPRYGEVLVFLGADARFYAFDGSQIFPLSTSIELDNRISQFSLDRLNKIYLSSACAISYEERHWYSCWLPITTYNNWHVTWDYYADSWWPNTGIEARCCGIGLDDGKRKVYFIQDDGKVGEFNDGDDDNGTAISAVYDTKKFDYRDHPLLKAHRYIDTQFKNIGDYNINFRRRSDWVASWETAKSLNMSGGGFILGTSKLGTGKLGGSEATSQTVDIPTLSHSEQFRFSTSDTNPPWYIYKADIVASGTGRGKSG